jgi:hypothetical protein
MPMTNNTKVLTYLIDGQPATARALANDVGLSVQQSQNVCSELYRIGVLDRDDKLHTYALGKQLSKRANKKLLLAAIRDGKTGTAALIKLVASVGGVSRRTSATAQSIPKNPIVDASKPGVLTIREVVPSKTYNVAVRQLLSRFVADVEMWDELVLAKNAEQSASVELAATELKALTSSLFDRLQELAWLREGLQELAIAEGLDPSLFDGVGMGESDYVIKDK